MSDDLMNTGAEAAPVAVPELPEGAYEGVLGAVAGGGDVDGALDALRDQVRDSLLEAGGDSAMADHAADRFVETFRSELFDGQLPVVEAAEYARQATQVAIDTYDPSALETTPGDALLSAIASGKGVDEAVSRVVQKMAEDGDLADAGEDVEATFLQSLQNALADGQSAADAVAGATDAAKTAADSRSEASVPVENSIVQALADGKNVGDALQDAAQSSGGDADAFVSGLEQSLADGVGADQAMGEAEQSARDVAQAKSDSQVELSAADKLAASLSSGENVKETLEEAGGGESFASTLENALAGGADAGSALNQAGEAEKQQQQVADQQSVPLSPADQLAASLSSGENVEETLKQAGGDGAFAGALEQSLAEGMSPGDAVETGQQASNAAQDAQQQQSVPVSAADQLAASLASGENVEQAIENAGGGEAFGEELAASLASGQSPSDSVAEAQSAENAAQTTADAQTVPADPAVKALAQGGEAAENVDLAEAVADATGTTGGEQTQAPTDSGQTDGTATETAQTASGPTESTAADQSGGAGDAAGGDTTGGDEQQAADAGAPEAQQTKPTGTTDDEPAADETPSEEPEQKVASNAEDADPSADDQTTDDSDETSEEGEKQVAEAETPNTDQTPENAPGEDDTDKEPGEEVTEQIQQVAALGTEGGDTEGDGTEGGDTGDGGGSDTGGQTPSEGTGGPETLDEVADDLQDINTAAGGNQGGGGSGFNGQSAFDAARNASNIGGSQSTLGSGSTGGTGTTGTTGTGGGGSDRGTSGRTTETSTRPSSTPDSDPDPIAPTANTGSGTFDQNASGTGGKYTVDLSSLVSDADGGSYTFTLNTQPSSGTATLSGSVVTFDPGQDFEYLADGESETVSFSYTVSESAGSSSNTVSLIVTGTNDVPAIALDAGDSEAVTQTETDGQITADGTLSVADIDLSNTVGVSVTGVTATGDTNGLGDAALRAMMSVDAGDVIAATATDGTINWSFASGAQAFDHLAANENLSLTYEITATDSDGATATHTVTVTVQGTNDAPTITVEAGDSAAQTVAETDAGLTTTGTLSVGDLDTTNTVASRLINLSVSGDDTGVPSGLLETMMSVGAGAVIGGASTTGDVTWTFDSGPVAFDLLAEGEEAVLDYQIEVSDGTATATQTVRVTVRGTNDAPVIFADAFAGDVDAVTETETDGEITADGTLSVADIDLTNTVGVSVTGVTPTGDTNGLGDAALRAMMSVDAGDVISAAAQGGTINWSFASGTEAFDHLGVGDRLELAYEITATDSDGGTGTHTVTVTVEGTNDAPTITVDGGDSAAKTVIETDAGLTTDGTLSVADVDTTDTVDARVVNLTVSGADAGVAPSVLEAMMSVTGGEIIGNAATTGDLTWTFDSGAVGFDQLAAGEELFLDYEIEVSDGVATATQTVRVTVRGTNDAPTVSGAVDADTVGEDAAPVVIDLLANAADVDNNADMDVANVTVTAADSRIVSVAAVDTSNGTITIDPTQFQDLDDDDTLELTVNYNVVDGQGGVTPATATLTVQGSNDVPALASAGGVLVSEDFEAGATGWTGGATTAFGAQSNILGQFAIAQSTSKTFSIPGDAGIVTISFDFLKIDSWDGEDFVVTLNGTELVREDFNGGIDAGSPIFTSVNAGSNLGGASWASDQIFAAQITLTAAQIAALPDDGSGGKTFTLGFSSTLDQVASDESWGIDNLVISADGEVVAAGNEDTTIAFTGMSVNDIDGDAVTVTLAAADGGLVSAGQNGGGATIDDAGTGTMTISGSVADVNLALATLTYSPVANFNGVSSVSVTVNDGTVSSSQTYPVVIAPVNDVPDVSGPVAGGAHGEDDAVFTVSLLDNASDLDGDDVDTASVAVTSSDLRVVAFTIDDETGVLTIDPAQFGDLDDGELVDLTISYTVVDGNGGTTPATASATVTGANDAPTIATPSALGDIGPEVYPADNTIGDEYYPAVAVFPDGSYVFAFSSQDIDGNGSAVVFQRYDENGNKVGSNTQANTYTTNDQINVEIAGHADGSFTIVWSSAWQDGSSWSVQGQRFNADGSPDGGEFQLNTNTSGDQVHPHITALPNGGEVISWSDETSVGSGDHDLMMRVYDAAGNEVTAGPVRVNTTTAGTQYHWTEHGSPGAGYDDGSFILTWSSQNVDGSGYAAVYQRFDANGDPIGNETRINTTTQNDQHTPSVTVLPNGNTVIVWSSDLGGATGWQVHSQTYDANFNPIGGETTVNTTSSGTQAWPDIVTLADGGYVVAWSSDTGDGSSWGVYAQQFDASGNAVGGERLINTYTNSEQRNPQLAADSDGGYYVAFNNAWGDGSSWGAALVKVDGGGISGSEDTDIAISGVSVGDVDGDNVTVTVEVPEGLLSANSGAQTGMSLSFTGTVAAVNASLASLVFTPVANANGTVDMTVSVEDGTAAAVTDTVAITVNAVNDAPEIVVPGVISITDAGSNGNDASFSVASVPNFTDFPTTTGTVEVWFQTTDNNEGAIINYAESGADNQLLLVSDNGSMKLFNNDVETVSISHAALSALIGADFNDGDWHHAAISFDANSGNVTVYMDGIEILSDNSFTAFNGNGTLVLGQDQDTEGGQFQTNWSLVSRFDGLRVWDSARDGTTIAAEMREVLNPADHSDLIADYRMDNGLQSSVQGAPDLVLQNADFEGGTFGVEDVSVPLVGLDILDVEGDVLTVQITGTNGTVAAFANDSGATVNPFGTGVEIVGTPDEVRAVLSNATFTGDPDFAGTGTVSVSVDDGNGGTTSTSFPVEIQAVDDAPAVAGLTESSRGLELDGVDGEVTIVSSGAINVGGTSPVTVELWIRPDDTARFQAIVDKSNPALPDYSPFRLHLESDGSLSVWNGSTVARTGANVVTEGELQHLAVSFDGSTITFYVDGTEVYQQGNFTLGTASGDAWRVGHDVHTDRNFDGLVDDVRIWSVARSEAEIQANMDGQLADPANETGLQINLIFDGSDGITVVDATGNGHTGAISGGASIVTGGAPGSSVANGLETAAGEAVSGVILATDAEGDTIAYGVDTGAANGTVLVDPTSGSYTYTPNGGFTGRDSFVVQVTDGNGGVTTQVVNVDVGGSGNAAPTLTNSGGVASASFNGTNYIDVPETAVNQMTTGTIEAWVYMDDLTDETIFAKQYNNNNSMAVLRVVNGEIHYQSTNAAGLTSNGITIGTGAWHHVAVSFDKTGAEMFIDGALVNTSNADFEIPNFPSINPALGGSHIGQWAGHGGGKFFNGQIAEFRVWDARLDQTAIQSNMNVKLTGTETDLRLLYDFDGVTNGGTVADATGSFDGISQNVTGSASDAPLSSVYSGREGVDLPIQNLSVGDTDGDLLTVTLTPGHGVLSATASGNASVASAAGGVLTVQGTAADVNATLQSVVLTPPQGFTGSTSVLATVSDGFGEAQSTVDVEITPNLAPEVDAAQNAIILGAADYVDTGDSAALEPGTGDLTVEGWFYWPGAGMHSGLDFVWSKGNTDGSTDEGYSLFINGDWMTARVSDGSQQGETSIDLSGINAGWHHVAMVIDQNGGGELRGYLDGSEAGWREPGGGYTDDWTPGDISPAGDSFVIGNPYNQPGAQGDGYTYAIDDVRVWSEARSGTDILNGMNQQMSGSEEGLVANWSFNEAGTTAVDSTGNGHDGTVSAGGGRENLVQVSISNNDQYKGLLLGKDADGDQLSYSIADGPDHGTVEFNGGAFIYDHDGSGHSDSFTVEISDGTDTVTEQIDVTVV